MPSFAIEVPGEASPLTEGALVQTLQSASSSHPTQIQTGTSQLSQWEKAPGFYRHLQTAYLNKQLPTEIRYLAIIQLKNGIDKYWRKVAANAVPNQDKNIVRSRLLESILSEEDNRLALQDALVIAKIARYEFPLAWPEAISSFVSCIRSPNTPPLQLARALLALLHIVKELSTGRLQRTRQHLQAATPEVVAVVGSVYAQLVDKWRAVPNPDVMYQSLLAIKLLRRLLISGHEHPNRDQDVTAFWNLSLEHLKFLVPLLDVTAAGGLTPEAFQLAGRHTLQLAKLHHEMARGQPAAFALLPHSLQLVQSYWGLIKDFGNAFGSKDPIVSALASAKIGSDGDAGEEKQFVEKIALKGLLVIRACVKLVHNPTQTFKYRTPEDKEERKNAIELLQQTLLTESFVREAMETLVIQYFVFRTSDLREWLEEPEEWEKKEEGDGEDWEFSVRSCAEKLFLDLAINYKAIIIKPLLNVFYSVASPNNEDVKFKDSVYTAIGLSASVVHEQLDFDAFIRDVLAQEVQKQSPGFNILRRRAAILLGQWISIKVSEENRTLVYQIFQHLLNPDDPLNDQVVRVTAGRQAAKIVDEWEFKAEQFLPYAQTIFTRLMQLIGEVELTETKMALLNTMSVMVERLERHVVPFAEGIVSLLPSLWEQSGDEHLMKQAILTILARLVEAMKAHSLPLHSMVFSIIKGTVEPGSETQVYLLEDALVLWQAVLTQTPTGSASPEFLDLVQYLYPIYALGSESLRQALEITELYILLAPQHMLSAGVRPSMFRALSAMLSGLRPEANGRVCNIVETMLRLAQDPEVAAPLSRDEFSNAVIYDSAQANDPENGNFGFLHTLLQGLRGSWTAHCTTGPNAEKSPVDGIVETDYFAILARSILLSLDGFLYTCRSAASAILGEENLESTMKWLLEEWFSHLENVGDPSRKKLMCLALTKLLETSQPFILAHLQSLMTTWTDVVIELREDAADIDPAATAISAPSPLSDALVWADRGTNHPTTTTSEPAYGPESPDDARRRALAKADDVHTIRLPEYIRDHLQQTIAACGGAEAFQERWLVNVDREVVKAFSGLGIL